MDPSLLFTTSGTTGYELAYLAPNRGDKTSLVEGFLSAAEDLAGRLAAQELPPDIIVYGALYLYRHGLEIGLKALLHYYHYVEYAEDKEWDGHDLKALWDELEPQLDTIDHMHEEAEYFEPEQVEYIGECVRMLHEIDPDGQRIRYTEIHNGQWTLKDVEYVRLDVLLAVCQRTSEWMHNVMNHMHMADNFYRGKNGYWNAANSPTKSLTITPIIGSPPGGPIAATDVSVYETSFEPWDIVGGTWPPEVQHLTLRVRLIRREAESVYLAATSFADGTFIGEGLTYLVEFPSGEYKPKRDRKDFQRALKAALFNFKRS